MTLQLTNDNEIDDKDDGYANKVAYEACFWLLIIANLYGAWNLDNCYENDHEPEKYNGILLAAIHFLNWVEVMIDVGEA